MRSAVDFIRLPSEKEIKITEIKAALATLPDLARVNDLSQISQIINQAKEILGYHWQHGPSGASSDCDHYPIMAAVCCCH